MVRGNLINAKPLLSISTHMSLFVSETFTTVAVLGSKGFKITPVFFGLTKVSFMLFRKRQQLLRISGNQKRS